MTVGALLLGTGAGLGVVVVVAGLRGARPPRAAWSPLAAAARRAAPIVAASIAAYALTGWPALAVLTAVAAVAVPGVLRSGARAAAAARTEAVAEWIEMVRDTMAGAAGLEEAITVSARRPPRAIATAVTRLAARLERHPLDHAVRAFAAEVDDPNADLVAAALATAAVNPTRDLQALLAALVEATRAQVQMRAGVDVGRAHVRSATRLVLGITAVFVVALLTFSRAYLDPYATLEGQLWLLVVGGLVGVSLRLLARMDRIDVPATRLVGAPPAEGRGR